MHVKFETLGEALVASATRWGGKAALMEREGDGFREITYADLLDQARWVTVGLQSAGVQPGDRVAIISENRPEWAYTDWGAQLAGVVTVPLYPTLSPQQVAYILRDSGSKVVFCADAALQKKCAEAIAMLNDKPTVVSFDSVEGATPFADFCGPDAARSGDRPHQGGDRPHRGTAPGEPAKRDPDEVCTLIYTSGTTGDPKGVMLTHRNFLFNIETALTRFQCDENDLFLSFLPLSHVYERMAGHYLPICIGATIAYAKSLRTLANDIKLARPTVMLFVPRFLELFQDKIVSTATAKPGLQRRLFNWALATGRAKAQGRSALLAPIADLLVGKKIRAQFGGRIRMFVAGGAALPVETGLFYSAFGFKVIEGYGLTETSPVIAINPLDDIRFGTVGPLLPGVEAKIAQDGEILTRSPSVMKGYFNHPEATAEAIDTEGWFHTGDIGEFDKDGYLRITDRKKDLLVLANGKNVAPQPIEALLKSSPLIEEAVVLGDGQSVVTALIVPNLAAVKGLTGEDGTESDAVKKAIKVEVDRLCKVLADYERVRRFALLDRGFSIESGELTPTLKVKRKVVKEKYAAQIASLGGD